MLYRPAIFGRAACVPSHHFAAPFTVHIDNCRARRARIRPATSVDFQAVRSLLRACNLTPSDLEPSHKEHFHVCVAGEEVVGGVGLVEGRHAALLRALAVAEGGRRQGIGARLLAAAEQHASRLGCGKMYVVTTRAEGYFSRHGYELLTRPPNHPAAVQAVQEASWRAGAAATSEPRTLVAWMRKSLGAVDVASTSQNKTR